jgi:hypothetical protein
MELGCPHLQSWIELSEDAFRLQADTREMNSQILGMKEELEHSLDQWDWWTKNVKTENEKWPFSEPRYLLQDEHGNWEGEGCLL